MCRLGLEVVSGVLNANANCLLSKHGDYTENKQDIEADSLSEISIMCCISK